MKNKFLIKIVASVLIAGELLLGSGIALAQLGAINPVPTSDAANGAGGLTGTIANAAVTTALGGAEAANTACAVAEQAFFSVDGNTQLAFGGLELISGGKSLLAKLQIKMTTIEGFITCRNAVLKTVKAIVTPNIFTATQKQTLVNDITVALASLKDKQEPIRVQTKNAGSNFWKSIVVLVLLKTTKAVSQRVINGLTSKYKINNVMQYADAVASQVYTTQLIRERGGDNQEQLILRSLATNPALRNRVDSAIYQRAADALEYNGQVFSARTMSADDPDFYLKLAKYGNTDTSVPYLKSAYENRASEVNAVGLASAQNEILLGSGLKAPRTCEGNVNEQQGIDQKWAQVNDEYHNRQKLLRDLESSHVTLSFGGQLTAAEAQKLESDIAKAKSDFENASRKLVALPKSYPSPVLEICKYIASPAEMVNKGIDSAFKEYSKKLGTYDENNLPFFMTFISDIGSNIAQNLIFGGDPKTSLLVESGNIATAVNLGINYADAQQSQKNLENGVQFDYSASATAQGSYLLNWEILNIKDASYVTISGPGISDVNVNLQGGPTQNRLPLSGNRLVTAPNGGTYSLRVFNSKGVPLSNTAGFVIPKPENIPASGSTTFVPGPGYQQCIADGQGEAYCRGTYGSVRGAFIKKPSEPLRSSLREGLR